MEKGEINITKILREFEGNFDIDRIKDRTEHKYFKGDEASKKLKDFIKQSFASLLQKMILEDIEIADLTDENDKTEVFCQGQDVGFNIAVKTQKDKLKKLLK